jgi:adenine deaminase
MVVVLSEIESKVREIKEGSFNFREKDKVRVFMGERYEKMNSVLLGFISSYFSLYSLNKIYGGKGFGGKDDE